MISFQEAMLKTDLAPSTLLIDGEESYTVKGMHEILLGGLANRYKDIVKDEVRTKVVDAMVCAASEERDPAEAIKYLVNSGVDAPIDFIATIVDGYDFLDEYQLLHPPELAYVRETEDGPVYEKNEDCN